MVPRRSGSPMTTSAPGTLWRSSPSDRRSSGQRASSTSSSPTVAWTIDASRARRWAWRASEDGQMALADRQPATTNAGIHSVAAVACHLSHHEAQALAAWAGTGGCRPRQSGSTPPPRDCYIMPVSSGSGPPANSPDTRASAPTPTESIRRCSSTAGYRVLRGGSFRDRSARGYAHVPQLGPATASPDIRWRSPGRGLAAVNMLSTEKLDLAHRRRPRSEPADARPRRL